MAMHPLHRMLASNPYRAEPRGRQSLGASHGVRCFDRRASRHARDCRARVEMIATAGIGASGIVGAYFESGQTWRPYSHDSPFTIIENGGLRQEREASMCVNARGLRVYLA
ncbi:hypothetical protein BO443_190007 [Burkholderia orbicola]